MSKAAESESDRRPLAVRSQAWAQRCARWIASRAITPNQISLLSIFFAALGALSLLYATRYAFLLAALCIQLRLLCNLFDGMVAIEGGKASATGSLFNEVPDRIADPLLLIAAGYALRPELHFLGWLAALLAVGTAYVRVLGGALGRAQDFRGPMAKQQRMAILTIACVVACLVSFWHSPEPVLILALAVITLGSAWTCVRRLSAIAASLRS
jgi:phosphatidylglycerophosphate synthase